MEKALQKQTLTDGLLEVGKGILIGCIISAMLMVAFWLGGYTAGLN